MINNIDITNRINKTPDYRIDLANIKKYPLKKYINKYNDSLKNDKINESIEWNNNNLGNYINFTLNTKQSFEYIDEMIIDIDNINKNNNNIFSFNYDFINKINNINYFDIINVCIPNNIFINRSQIDNNNIIYTNILNNINLIKDKTNMMINSILYTIHNYQEINKTIYFSINRDYNIVYYIIIENGNIILNYKYELDKNILFENNSKIYLSITNLDNHLINTTSNINYYTMLYIDKKIENNLYYKTRNCFHLYKKSELLNISKLKINLFLNQDNILYNKYYDNTIEINDCNCEINNRKPGCKCIYILQPNYFRIIISLRLGVYKMDMINGIIK